jgi:hypothetical protein
MSVPLFRFGPPGHFTHVPSTTPVASALKNCYAYELNFLEAPADFFTRFWVQVAVLEVKWPLRSHFGIETVQMYNGKVTDVRT